MPRRIVLLGAPASGKGTQAALIAPHLDLANLSTGALIRSDQFRGTPRGKLADQHLADGGFLPDELMLDIMGVWIDTVGRDGFVIDGFPRTLRQAESLDSSLAASGLRLDAVIFLEVDIPTLRRRVSTRVQCSACGIALGNSDAGSGSENSGFIPCPSPGCIGGLSPRSDDSPQIFAKRLENYRGLTAPLVNYYERGGILKRVDAAAPAADVFTRILQSLGLSSGATKN